MNLMDVILTVALDAIAIATAFVFVVFAVLFGVIVWSAIRSFCE